MSRTGPITGRQLHLGTRIRERLARANIVGTFIKLPRAQEVLIDRRTLLPETATLGAYRVEKREAQRDDHE